MLDKIIVIDTISHISTTFGVREVIGEFFITSIKMNSSLTSSSTLILVMLPCQFCLALGTCEITYDTIILLFRSKSNLSVSSPDFS